MPQLHAPDEPGASVLGPLSATAGVRDRVVEVLREAMVVGELEPGVVYSAPALAKMLGVSATPVREAMMELALQGHVEILRQRGYRIRAFSPEELDQLLEVRELLEVPAVGRAADMATGEQVAALRPLADHINEAARRGELREFIAADTALHCRLLACGGNDRLVGEVWRLRGLSRLLGLRRLHEEGVLVVTAQEHHQLLDLVEAGDREGAQALMRGHLGHVRGVWAGRAEDLGGAPG